MAMCYDISRPVETIRAEEEREAVCGRDIGGLTRIAISDGITSTGSASGSEDSRGLVDGARSVATYELRCSGSSRTGRCTATT
jgi:hypothetical protein